MCGEIILKYKQIHIVVESYGEWVIQADGEVYFSDEETGAYWESAIAIFRDYTNEILYKDFLEEVNEDMETQLPFSIFVELVADSFKVFEL